jgi:hypothetical protein
MAVLFATLSKKSFDLSLRRLKRKILFAGLVVRERVLNKQ